MTKNAFATTESIAARRICQEVMDAENFDAAAFITAKLLGSSGQGSLLSGLAWHGDDVVAKAVEVQAWRMVGRLTGPEGMGSKDALAMVIAELQDEVDRGPEDSSTGRAHNFVGRERWEATRKLIRIMAGIHKGL